MKKIVISVAILLISGTVLAQNALEALRFNQTTFGGTARVLGVSGAFGAVGGDLSSAGINPAGLGLMRRNDFAGSLGFSNYKVTGNYIGIQQSSGKFVPTIPNIGIAGTNINYVRGREAKSGVVSNTFAFNYQRVNNFQRNISFTGNNTQSSILDYYAEITNGWTPYELDEYADPIYIQELAWRTYLIDPVDPNNPDNNTEYVAAIYDAATDVKQQNSIRQKGAMHEMNFAYAMNISNVVYLGFGLNVITARFEEVNTFTETDNPNDLDNNYQGSEFITDFNTRGSGVNTRLGILARLTDYFRAGLSYQSATNLKLNDEYYYEMTGRFDDGDVLTSSTPVQFWDYSLRMPSKLTLSGALILGKRGFISLDMEEVDYTDATLARDGEDYSYENNDIRTIYDRATNYRLGFELVEGLYRLRAGYAYYGTAYNDRILPENRGKYATQSFSIGGGIFTKEYYLDFAVVNTRRNEFYSPYTLQTRPYSTADNKLSNTNLVITIGAKFD